MKPQYKGTVALLGSALMYGSFGALFRVIGYSLPIFYQAAIRALLAALITGAIILIWKQWQSFTRETMQWIIWRGVIGVGATLAFFSAVNHVDLGTSYFVFYGGSTVAGYILGKLWFNEQLNRVKLFALLLGLVGLTLVYWVSAFSFSSLFLFFALAAGVCTSFWNIISKHIPDKQNAFQLTFLDTGLSFILLAAISVMFRETWVLPTNNSTWIAMATLGIFFASTGALIVYGFRLLGAQIGSLVMLSEIVFALVFSFLFYREIPSLTTMIGGVLIMAAVALPELPKKYLPFLYENRRHGNRG